MKTAYFRLITTQSYLKHPYSSEDLDERIQEKQQGQVATHSYLVHKRYTLVSGLHEVVLGRNDNFACVMIHRQEETGYDEADDT